ncbi:MAG: hypothetical protein DWH81_11700 [Planctomycetota bacterium]|nr:MAG: hypothetical protein DWH81_11700 [Planctomycetota bacterium]
MNPLVAHLISGQILFTALLAMVLLIILYENCKQRGVRRLCAVLVCNSCLLGVCTAAYPWWLLGTLLATVGGWSVHSWIAVSGTVRNAITAAPIMLAWIIVVTEAGWAMRPAISPISERSVVVFGDSLSAGLGEKEGTPWPDQLRDRKHVAVTNLSEAGATTADGLKNVFQTDHVPGLVIIELGGNDLLGGVALADFEKNLDGILSHLRSHNRTVVMVELPLLPGKNAWGGTQRRLSRQYRCRLIPKRLLVDVLAAPGSTTDTLHLSQTGHQRLAEQIWSVIGPGLPSI